MKREHFTKQIVLSGAVSYAQTIGLSTISARKLAGFLGCSTQPIYRHFNSMSDLKKEVCQRISDHLFEEVSDFETFQENINLLLKKNQNQFWNLFLDEVTGRFIFESIKKNIKLQNQQESEMYSQIQLLYIRLVGQIILKKYVDLA